MKLIKFLDLSVNQRRLVRLLRRHLLLIFEKDELKFQDFQDKAIALASEFLSQDKLKSLAESERELLLNVAVYDQHPPQNAKKQIWRHEFSDSEYPPVDKTIDTFARVALKLETGLLFVFLDSLTAVSKEVADAIREKLTDYSVLKNLDNKQLQVVLREADTKVISDSLKILSDEYCNRFRDNMSDRNFLQVEKDIRYHKDLPDYKAELAVIDLLKLYWRLKEAEQI